MAAVLGMMNESGKSIDASNLKIFQGQGLKCSRLIAGAKNCCTDSGLIKPIFACGSEEKELAVKKDEKLCHYVGSYCSSSFLGVCITKKKSYCCFSSKLSRSVMVQGKSQLGSSWGTAEHPNCDGLSPAQLQQVDMSNIDLSEIYPEIDAKTNTSKGNSVVQAIKNKINNNYNN